MLVPGITLVGPLPPEIQNQTIYAGAIATDSTAPEADRAFLAIMARSCGSGCPGDKGMTQP